MDGPVPLPDIVICLEAPWDVEKSVVLNMSINLLSFMTNLAFPFGGFGTSIYDYDSGGDWNNTLIHELNKEYKDILLKTGWNVVELLNSAILAMVYLDTSLGVPVVNMCLWIRFMDYMENASEQVQSVTNSL